MENFTTEIDIVTNIFVLLGQLALVEANLPRMMQCKIIEKTIKIISEKPDEINLMIR